MGVVTAQILILIISAVVALVGWVLIRRAMNRVARSSAAGSVVPGSQAMFAVLVRTQWKLVPAETGPAAALSRAPPGAPPAFLLQPNRLMLAE